MTASIPAEHHAALDELTAIYKLIAFERSQYPADSPMADALGGAERHPRPARHAQALGVEPADLMREPPAR